MKNLSFVIGLKKSYDDFQSELAMAEESSSYEYFRFLKTMKFYDFVDQIVTACTMYPRNIDLCRDNLSGLAYVMYRTVGLGIFYLTTLDQSRLTDLIFTIGNDVISTLDSHGYYWSQKEMDRAYTRLGILDSDLIAVPNVTKIGTYSFRVDITENSQDDIPALKTLGLESPNIRSY